MKKVFLVLCALAISSLFSYNVSANQNVSDKDAQIVQTFCNASDLYAYVNIPKEKDSSALIAKATIDGTYSCKQSEPIAKAVTDTKPVSYLFLIDISTSMPSYKDNIKTFINDFMSDAGTNASYGIATFGDSLKINLDFSKDQDKIKKNIDDLKFDVKQTSLYSSIINAINYYEKKKRSDGELYNIVVITDGIEYDKNGVSTEDVYKKIKSSPVIIHTLGFPTKSTLEGDRKTSEEALKILGSFAKASLGVDTALKDTRTESDSAKEITDFVNNLYITKFDLIDFDAVGGSHNLKIVFATTGENGDMFEAQGTFQIQDPNATAAPGITVTPAPGGSDGNMITDTKGTDTACFSWNALLHYKVFKINLWLLIVTLMLLVLILIGMIVLLRKRRRSKRGSPDQGIFMKAEVLSGNCDIKNNQFYLSDELIIGRDRDCDIRLMNKDISKKNSRLYVRDNIIYIEDLNSTNGTTINNMKIFSPNKLRSGDIVSIGSVKFILKF